MPRAMKLIVTCDIHPDRPATDEREHTLEMDGKRVAIDLCGPCREAVEGVLTPLLEAGHKPPTATTTKVDVAKPFACTEKGCTRRFSTQGRLTNHVHLSHTEEGRRESAERMERARAGANA